MLNEWIKELKNIDITEYTEVLKCAKKCAKYAEKEKISDLKIAVLGDYSIQFFVMVLRMLLLKYGIKACIYEGEYNGINMDVLNDDSEFYRFSPEITIILSDYRSLRELPMLLSDPEVVNSWVDNQVKNFVNLWEKIQEKLPGCYIMQANLVVPYEREIGNLEANYYFSKQNVYKLLNMELLKKHEKYVTLVDMEYLAGYVGKRNWFDDSAYMLNKLGFSIKYIGLACDIFARQIIAAKGKIKKCLVLDLDNTLWGGVVGDDGYDGIQLDPNNAIGEAYLNFQRYVLRLKNRGVILAVCSKNDMETAKEPFEKNENMLLKLDDIASFIANWEDKAGNLEKIAKELNIGIDSLVFFDDNPAEREIVKMYQPDVWVVDVPEDPAEYVKQLNMESPFEWVQITKEDISRSSSYIENKKRDALEQSFTNYDEYLKALNMKGKVKEIASSDVERFSQLINKSNQFNLRTQRYSEVAIEEFRNDLNKKVLAITLEDKFSNYGIISCIILEKQGEKCFINTWLMSCRVLKRGVEFLAFEKILEVAKQWGCSHIVGEYIPTKKNMMVKNFYQELGFVPCMEVECDCSELYSYDCNNEFEKKYFIKGE